ncbi:MAG TPA: basic secretory protein-like protein [Tepidisphaeraceae bacterium]|jgi:hypothetical protein|nr:basic secretory protein-like protein [Tepidisphaeraceae bacterium]
MNILIALTLACMIRQGAVASAQSPPAKPAATIVFDTSEAPEMADFARKAQVAADEWYPRIVEKLPSPNFVPADHISVVFKPDYKGVAATSGDRITCSVKWFTSHPDDVGAIVHELTHVVQAYKKPGTPGWLIEGIADYIRWFNYEPISARPHPKADKARYDASYRTTAAFLDWASRTYDKDLVAKLNAAAREGRYSENVWKEITGKTVQDLGHEWKESLAEKKQ